MKKILFYIEYYIFNLPLYLLHEMSHWLFIIPFWILGLCSFPILHVTRWAYCEVCDDGIRSQMSFNMHVSYTNHLKLDWLPRMCASTPVVATILLFWVSPWYMYFYYFSHINTLWLSDSDIDDILN